MDDFSTLVSQTTDKLEDLKDPYAQQVRRTVRAIIAFEEDVKDGRDMKRVVEALHDNLEPARTAQKVKGFDKQAKITFPAKSRINQKNSSNTVAGLKAQLTPVLQNLSAKSGEYVLSDYYRPTTPTQTDEQTAATNAGQGAGALPTATAKDPQAQQPTDGVGSFFLLPGRTATPLDPQAQQPTDGVPAGGTSKDAYWPEEWYATTHPNVNDDNVSLQGDAEDGEYDDGEYDDAGDTSTATALKTGDGTTNPIGATADGVQMTVKQAEEVLRRYNPTYGRAGAIAQMKAQEAANVLGIPKGAPAYPDKGRSETGDNTNDDNFLNAMNDKGLNFFSLYEEDDSGYNIMGLKPGQIFGPKDAQGLYTVLDPLPRGSAGGAGPRPPITSERRKELEDALEVYEPVHPDERTAENEQEFMVAKRAADELGILRNAPAYPKALTREGNTHADYFIDAMRAKEISSFLELYEEDDSGYERMGLEPGDTYNVNVETGEVYVVKETPNITGLRRGREDDDVDDRGGEKQRVVGGGAPNFSEAYKRSVEEAILREGSVYLKNLIAQGQQIIENAQKATAGMYGATGGRGERQRQENERRYPELVAQVNRITQEAQARIARVAEEQAEGGEGFPLPGEFNFYNFGAQNAYEALNQVIQQYGVNIPNAVERAAFTASMEQNEREDAREEARQAQVPVEAQKQRREAQQQRAAELREQQNAPPQTPAPVDVDIDIASLSLGDAGSVPSTQQLGDAMTQDRAKESMEQKHRESLSVQQLKQEIEALHSVYDSLIPEFKKGDHQRQKASAMASGRPEALRQHLENMMASVRRYYTQGGMRVGVIISRDAFMSMQGGQAGAMGGGGGMSVPATSQQSGLTITKHGQSKFRPAVRNEQVMRGGINTKKTLDNFIPKVDPNSRRPQRPHAQLTRFDHPHPSVQLPRRTRPYDIILKTKSK